MKSIKMIKEYSIKLDNSQINYVVFGKGKEPLVLIPGLSLQEVRGNGIFIAYMYRFFQKNIEFTVLINEMIFQKMLPLKNLQMIYIFV